MLIIGQGLETVGRPQQFGGMGGNFGEVASRPDPVVRTGPAAFVSWIAPLASDQRPQSGNAGD
jgi:hypothetical protein